MMTFRTDLCDYQLKKNKERIKKYKEEGKELEFIYSTIKKSFVFFDVSLQKIVSYRRNAGRLEYEEKVTYTLSLDRRDSDYNYDILYDDLQDISSMDLFIKDAREARKYIRTFREALKERDYFQITYDKADEFNTYNKSLTKKGELK